MQLVLFQVFNEDANLLTTKLLKSRFWEFHNFKCNLPIFFSSKQNWMALKGIPTEMSDNVPIQDKFLMPNSDSLTPDTHYSFCKVKFLSITDFHTSSPIMASDLIWYETIQQRA